MSQEKPNAPVFTVQNRNQPFTKGQVLNSTPSHYYSFKPKSQRKPKPAKTTLESEVKYLVETSQRLSNFQTKYFHKKTNDLETLQTNLKLMNQEIHNKATGLETTEEEILNNNKAAFARINTLKNQIEQEKAMLAELHPKVQASQEESFALNKKALQLSNYLNTMDSQVENLKTQNSSLLNSKRNLESKRQDLLSIKEEYTKQLQTYNDSRLQLYSELKKLNNKLQSLKGNIRVFCKVRPVLASKPVADLNIEDVLITLNKPEIPLTFSFDRVFGSNSTQDQVFEEVSQLIQSALDGYKVCIFAYGQTGSGKTYTMEGPRGAQNLSEEDCTEKGLVQRSVEQLFVSSEKHKQLGWNFRFFASFLEIYNEEVRDLLEESKKLKGFDTSLNRREVEVHSYADLSPLLDLARAQRKEAQTMCNTYSSRSHSLFQLRILGEKSQETIEGVLNMIDLAGSERLKKSQASGERLEETKSINKSLSALGDVIQALLQREKHIPYRNSKLTYLLKHCLGGEGKTLMFVNISPLEEDLNETLCSLRFAQKVNSCTISHAKTK